jgi:alpha-tubulin suppressor-like RCC1 family protein
MSNFTGPEGILKNLYITDVDILERYVGNQLWTWGRNSYGALGDNTVGTSGTSAVNSKSSPVQTVSGGTNWKQVSCDNASHIAVIKTDGTLWTWGQNSYGKLGTNDITNRSSPVQTVSGGTNWKQVSTTTNHTAAIKTDGTLWSWGRASEGQLGTNDITNRSSPVQTVSGGTNWKQVSSGGSHTAAIKTDGTLWLWGSNSKGQLGTNDITNRSSPVQTVSGGTNWKQVSSGGSHTAAIKTDGTLWLWGNNYTFNEGQTPPDSGGQLGDNTRTDRSSPVQTVSGGTNWKQVSAGTDHTSAIKTDGTLWSWGRNINGKLGTNNLTDRSSPVQTVSGGTNWKQVSAGADHTSAIKTDGTLWSWGSGVYGALGDNTRTNRSSPVQTITFGTNWKQVSVGRNFTAAVTFTES